IRARRPSTFCRPPPTVRSWPRPRQRSCTRQTFRHPSRGALRRIRMPSGALRRTWLPPRVDDGLSVIQALLCVLGFLCVLCVSLPEDDLHGFEGGRRLGRREEQPPEEIAIEPEERDRAGNLIA